jgi:polyisoprenoid-binding protein YceI
MNSRRVAIAAARACRLGVAVACLIVVGGYLPRVSADEKAMIPEGHRGDCAACHGKQRPNTFLFDSHNSLVVAEFRGVGAPLSAKIEAIRGGFTFDLLTLENSSVTVELDTTAVRSSDGLINNFLHSSQFLDSQKYPLIRFVSTSVRKKGEGKYEIAGDLTMHGTTVPSELEASFDGGGPDPALMTKYAAFRASGNLRCEDFRITLCSPSDRIQLDIVALGRVSP